VKPYRRILVPTDFSAHSALAVQTAADLSCRYGASLLLAYVYEPIAYALPDGYMLFSEPQLNSMFEQFDKRLSLEKQTAEAAGGLRVETQLLQGVAATEICQFAERAGCDLIVMGTHGRKGLPHVLLGSVAERVVRSAPCPVLTVRVQS
jgi:universal stress protein A